MNRLYSSPLRVYLCLGLLAAVGVWAGSRLPVSLFPNSAKPRIGIWMPYGGGTPEEFFNAFGRGFEAQLRSINRNGVEADSIRANYYNDGAQYRVFFRWGNSANAAQQEVQALVNAMGARLPEEVRKRTEVWMNKDNGGFLAISFYSERRSLDEVYSVLEPMIAPKLSKVQDADQPGIWNPSKKEIRVELIPERMAALQLKPRDLEEAVQSSMRSYDAGNVSVGTSGMGIEMPRQVKNLDDLGNVLVPTPSGRLVHLSEVARIDLSPSSSNSQSFKTSGAPSLILFANPKAGGNVKRMGEEILQIVRETMPKLPSDIQYRVLVDPSEFIRAAVNNVFHEVILGACLAVLVLFLFIGSFRNVITTAIEIPLSMVLAFILMRMSGMNLNLISLGGLALSAGMNVDASVVVMENIFRHFENVKGRISSAERIQLVSRAVAEVRFPVIASTIASLVVFAPLAFTSELSYAVLGDLAKTVVFSHGFSALVALILVPTVRLHLMSREKDFRPPRPPIEKQIRALEEFYGRALGWFIERVQVRRMVYAGLALSLAGLMAFALPRLPKEILGTPDTDWVILGFNSEEVTQGRQMEAVAAEVESNLLKEFGSRISYTFTQIHGNSGGNIMARLKDKREMIPLKAEIEKRFVNTPVLKFWVDQWNPAELPLPDPPDLRIAVRGGTSQQRTEAAQEVFTLLEDNHVFQRHWSDPNLGQGKRVIFRLNSAQWPLLRKQGFDLLPSDLADIARVATTGRQVGNLLLDDRYFDIHMRYPHSRVGSVEDIEALPIALGSKLVPLKALAQVSVQPSAPNLYRLDERELFLIYGKQGESKKTIGVPEGLKKAEELVAQWQSGREKNLNVTVEFEDAKKDLTDALKQLAVAVALSILLIFLTMVIQFGNVANALLVLVAVPLGMIGVITALTVFGSTLSLNSVLGVILLNGLAVANSIILVDFMKRLVDQGMTPRRAAVEAGQRRLRPILITSLTTILGMLPIALGMGQGGRILQPLGIAVAGGLWVSMGLTLFVVPALQVAWLEWARKGRPRVPAGAIRTNWPNDEAPENVGEVLPKGVPSYPVTEQLQ